MSRNKAKLLPKEKSYKQYLVDYCHREGIPIERYRAVLGYRKMKEEQEDFAPSEQ